MILAAALALALFGQPPQIKRTFVRAGGWSLQINTDRFDGSVACMATRRGVTLRGPIAVFATGSGNDTRDAEYRIDAGPAHSVHEQALSIAVLGAPKTTEPIDNPTRGLVVLPSEAFKAARYVYIRTNPHTAPLRFDVTGTEAISQAAHLNHCPWN